MRVLIVEDEALLAKRLQQLLLETDPQIEIAGTTSSIAGTLQWLSSHEKPDLVFMDIELADGQCFDIFAQAEVDIPVVFTTAYDEFALQAFKVNSVDYLLKPIRKEELQQALTKFRKLQAGMGSAALVSKTVDAVMQVLSARNPETIRRRFLVKQGQKLITIEEPAIAFFYVRNSICFLVTREKQKFVLDYTLDQLESILDPAVFFRVNRQYILSNSCIAAVHPWYNGKLKLELRMPVEEEIIVSRDKAGIFKNWMGA